MLRDLVSVRTDLLEPVFYPKKRFELSLYRNQVIHLFISEGWTIISAINDFSCYFNLALRNYQGGRALSYSTCAIESQPCRRRFVPLLPIEV